MKGQVFYLDTSAIVKRYVREAGSKVVRKIYLEALLGEAVLSFSIWNIGEVLGVLDRARNTGRLGEKEYLLARRRFLLETRRLLRLGQLLLVPLRTRILRKSWRLVEKYHVYQADALQIVSAKTINSTRFLVADKRLHAIALNEKLNSTLLA